MGAAVLLRDVVGEAEHRFLVSVGPLHRHVDRGALVLRRKVDDLLVQRGFQLRQMLDERANSALVFEHVVLVRALVEQFDLDARVEEGQLTQALGEDVVMEFGVGENFRTRVEAHRGAASRRRSDLLQRIQRFAETIFLLMLVAFAVDRQAQMVRQRIDHRDADAMQTAGNLVRVVVEFAARMQHGHDDLSRRHALFGVNADRNAATIVDHADRAVGMDRDDHMIAVTRKRFVDRVVDDLEHHVMQSGAVVGVADVHARTLSHRLEAFENLDVARIVLTAVGLFFGDFGHIFDLQWLDRRARFKAIANSELYHLAHPALFHVEPTLRRKPLRQRSGYLRPRQQNLRAACHHRTASPVPAIAARVLVLQQRRYSNRRDADLARYGLARGHARESP